MYVLRWLTGCRETSGSSVAATASRTPMGPAKRHAGLRICQLASAVLLIGLSLPCGRADAAAVVLPDVPAQPFPPTPFQPLPAATLIAPSQAAAVSSGQMQAMISGTIPVPSANAPEIVELARALKGDPNLIFQYVHDNIATLPQYDSVKGPVGALLDGEGTAFDQAELMALLLSDGACCRGAQVEVGQMTVPIAQLSNWLGVDAQPNDVSWALTSGGFPLTMNGSPSVTSVSIGWAWVKATVNGQVTYYDPSTKTYNRQTGVGNSTLASWMGYTLTSFLNSAEWSAQIGGLPQPTVSNMSTAGLGIELNGLAGNLASSLRSNTPTASMQDTIGGASIVPLPIGGQYGQTTSPGTQTTDYFPQVLPYRTTFTVYLPGAPGTGSATFNSSDLYGHALYVYFVTPKQGVG